MLPLAENRWWGGSSTPGRGNGAMGRWGKGAPGLGKGPNTFVTNRFAALDDRKPIDRIRSGSKGKGPRTDSEEGGDANEGGQRGRHKWASISETMGKMNDELNKVENSGNGELIRGVMAVFKTLEFNLNGISDTIFNLEEKVDWLMVKDSAVTNMINSNVGGGNLVDDLEKSKSYETLCKEMADSTLITKVYGVDLGEEVKGRDNLIKNSKKILEGGENKIHLRGATIAPLAQNSQLRDGVHTVPILVISKNKEDKKTVDMTIRERKYKTACHWPKSIVPEITKIRNQLKVVKDDNIDLTAMDILIRPHATGKSLTIRYRSSAKRSGAWTFLESVKTPSHHELALQFNGFQPCQSKYFKL